MSTLKTFILLSLIAILLFSCSSENKRRAKVSLRLYENYYNDINSKDLDVLSLNWDEFDIQLERTKLNAEHSIENLGNAPDLQKNFENISRKHQSLISRIEENMNQSNNLIAQKKFEIVP